MKVGWWWLVLCPELRRVPWERRFAALEAARKEDLDRFERIGVLAAVAFATWLTGAWEISGRLGGGVPGLIGAFLVAFVVLGATAGPLLVRRVRRGLRAYLGTQNGG